MSLNFLQSLNSMEEVIELVNYKAARAILNRIQPIAPDSSDDESDADEDLEHVEQAARRNERLIKAIRLLKDDVYEIKRKALVQKTEYLIADMIKLLLLIGGFCACLTTVLAHLL